MVRAIDNKTIGKNIQIARKSKGITQAKLASMIESNTASISSYENGRNKPNVDTLATISEALDVSMDQLYFGNAGKKFEISDEDIREQVVDAVIMLFDSNVISHDTAGDNCILLNKYRDTILQLIYDLIDIDERKDTLDVKELRHAYKNGAIKEMKKYDRYTQDEYIPHT